MVLLALPCVCSAKDLNKNGKVDPYEDPARTVEERVQDLLGQMTLDEKTCQLATL